MGGDLLGGLLKGILGGAVRGAANVAGGQAQTGQPGQKPLQQQGGDALSQLLKILMQRGGQPGTGQQLGSLMQSAPQLMGGQFSLGGTPFTLG